MLSPEQHDGFSFGQELSSNANSKDLLRVSQLPKPFTYIVLIEPHASFSADPAHTPDLAECDGKHCLDLSRVQAHGVYTSGLCHSLTH